MVDRVALLTETYHEARARLQFLDANLWLGRPHLVSGIGPPFASGFDLPALLRRLERYQIAGGVVSAFASIRYSVPWGNEQVLTAIQGTDLWAGVTLVPEFFVPEADGQAYLAQAISRGARLARVFPKTHNFSMRPWCSGALMDALAHCRLPLVVWHTEVSWEEIDGLCEVYPELPVIVEGTPLKVFYYNRLFYPLLARHPNLQLELHNLVGYLEVDDIVQRFGARQLVFGSYLPVYDPNAAMMMVTHACISEEDKMRIARQNLAELVEGVRTP